LTGAAKLEVPAPSPGKALLERHFEFIQRKLVQLGRQNGLFGHEAEELRSWALFKLVENDYRILARWEGRSSFSTYLRVVLVNLVRDYRIRVWGRWQSSAVAIREGSEAVLLEKLLVRDNLPLGEAIHRLRVEHKVTAGEDELEQLAARLPRRAGRRFLGEEELHRIPVDGRVEARLEDAERAHTAARLHQALFPLLQALPAEDSLILKLHYWEGLSIAAISPLLGIPQRGLYYRRDRCLKRLRLALKDVGLSADQVRTLFGSRL
jgi:RNA polymerase sigma factor (sigma-70 family)